MDGGCRTRVNWKPPETFVRTVVIETPFEGKDDAAGMYWAHFCKAHGGLGRLDPIEREELEARLMRQSCRTAPA